jgi:hypothetical protein
MYKYLIIAAVPVYHFLLQLKESYSRQVSLDVLYRNHLYCLESKGFQPNSKYKNHKSYDAIVHNDSLEEIERCKKTYIAWITAYYDTHK